MTNASDQQPGSRVAGKLVYLLLVLAGIAVAIWALNVTPAVRLGMDDFHPARFYHDLFVDGGSWGDWHLPAAPSYFPDLAVYFLILATGVSFLSISKAYALVMAALTGLIAYWLGTCIFGRKSIAVFVALIFLSALILAGEYSTFWNRPHYHYGVFFSALLVLGLLPKAASHSLYTIPLCLVVILSVVSDFLFIPVIASASTAAIAVMWLTGLTPLRNLYLVAAIGASVVLGYYFHFIVTPQVPTNPIDASALHIRYGLFHPLSHWIGLRFALINLWNPLNGIAGALCIVSLWAVWADRHRRSWFLVISAFFFSGVLGNLYVVGLDTSPDAFDRYSIFATTGTLAYIAFCSGFIAERFEIMRYTLPLTLLVVAVTGALSSDTNKGLQQFSEMANTGDCLVRTVEIEGLRYGLASFFNANRYTVLMDNRIVLTPVRGNSLRFLRWQSSDAWSDYPVEFVVAEQSVRPTIYEKKRNTYPLSEEIVLKDAGEPVSRHVCGDLVVLTYK